MASLFLSLKTGSNITDTPSSIGLPPEDESVENNTKREVKLMN